MNEEIVDILKYSIEQITGSPALRNKIELLYVEIGHESICAKRANAVRKAFRKFNEFLASGKTLSRDKREATREKIKKVIASRETMGQFGFKDGSTIYIREPFFAHFSNKNITDESAIAILKANPRNIAHFAKYPSNWQDLVNGKAKPAENFFTEAPVEEITDDKKQGRKKEKVESE